LVTTLQFIPYILRKFEFVAIQGHWQWCQSKAHTQLPISHW